MIKKINNIFLFCIFTSFLHAAENQETAKIIKEINDTSQEILKSIEGIRTTGDTIEQNMREIKQTTEHIKNHLEAQKKDNHQLQ